MTQSILERKVHYVNSAREIANEVNPAKPYESQIEKGVWKDGHIVRTVEVEEQEASQMKRTRSFLDLIDAEIARQDKK